jgi:predicted nuclease of predicted toxin-antitoxin system
MRIKLDENLPVRLAAALDAMGNDVETVYSERLSGARDDVVWTVSQDERRLLITQDLDFSDSRRFQPGNHHGIILVRLRTPGREVLFRRIIELFRTEDFEKWAGCFVVVTDHKIRIQRPRQ